MKTYELVLSHSRDTFNQLGATRILRKQLSLYFWVSTSWGVPEKKDPVCHSPEFWGESSHSTGCLDVRAVMAQWKSLVGLAECSLFKESEVICIISS